MRSPKTFRHGGLSLDLRREPDAAQSIRNAFLPAMAQILLKQHSGEASKLVVGAGEQVREGMVVGKPHGAGSAYIHASVPGTVKEIRRVRLPAGGECDAIMVALQGSFDRLGKRAERYLWSSMKRPDMLRVLKDKGVVETEGAGRPLQELLGPSELPRLVVLNCLETEPYLRTEAAVLSRKTEAVVEGLRIIAKLVEPERIAVALDDSDAELVDIFTKFSSTLRPEEAQLELRPLKPRFPQDLPGQLLETLAPHRGAKGGEVLFLRPSTLLAVFEAIVEARPFVERYLTVAGGAVRRPAVLKARIGSPIGDLIEECGGFQGKPERIVLGGPFRGLPVRDLDTPIAKTTNAVLALLPGETRRGRTVPCIRCGTCAEVCPESLDPEAIYRRLVAGREAEALLYGLAACSSCGACGYACPSRLPLVQVLARGKVAARPAHE